MTPRHCQAYQHAEVETADQGTLIILLYDGAIRFLQLSKQRLREKNYEAKGKLIVRAQEIVGELMSCLNMDAGEIAHSLSSIYSYMIRRLMHADLNKDVEAIDEVITLLSELREAWVEVFGKKELTEASAATTASAGIRGIV